MAIRKHEVLNDRPIPVKLPQFKNDKRIKRGNHKFMSALMDKIEQNNMQRIFSLPKEQLQLQLMELSKELLDPNALNPTKRHKSDKFWHLREDESLIQAEKLVKNFIAFTGEKFEAFVKAIDKSIDLTNAQNNPEQDAEYIEVALADEPSDDYIYDAYIDLIRTLMLQDQEGPPGSENLMQDLFNQYEGPAVVRPGACEVRITGAQFFPLPANVRNFVKPRTSGLRVPGPRQRRRSG